MLSCDRCHSAFSRKPAKKRANNFASESDRRLPAGSIPVLVLTAGLWWEKGGFGVNIFKVEASKSTLVASKSAYMQWSKLKSRFSALICDELRDRLDFHLTTYRQSHDGAGEIWLSLDGEKIFTCGHYAFEFAEREGYDKGLTGNELHAWLLSKGIVSPTHFGRSMKEYLDMQIVDALSSDDPLKRAFAIIDRRTGKRAIRAMEITENEHSLIKMFYNLRCNNEITPGFSTPDPSS